MNRVPPLRSPHADHNSNSIPWWALLISCGIVAVSIFNGLGSLGLVGPDEPRYAFIARAMLQTGDWVTPRLYGQPWFEKPVLYYWCAAAAFKIFGVSEFAARLPSALGLVFATCAMAWATFRAFGADAAWLTFLVLPTSVAGIGFARAATPDMLFTSLLAAAAAASAELLRTSRASTWWAMAFGAALGGATLAKGPAAIALTGGALACWVLLTREWRASLRLLHPAGILAFALVALPWYVACAVRNPTFLRVFIFEHNFERYLTPMFHHPQPVWFFGAVLAVGLLPWTALLIPLVISACRTRIWRNSRKSPALLFGCWAIFPVVFFSFSESKLPGYVLPAVPALVLLIAAYTARLLTETRRDTPRKHPEGERGETPMAARSWLLFAACAFPAISFAATQWLRAVPTESGIADRSGMLLPIVLLLLGGTVCGVLSLAGRLRTSVIFIAATMASTLLAVNARIAPKLDPYVSSRAASLAMPDAARNARDISAFELDRSRQYGFDFYLDRELPIWTPGSTPPTWLWTSEAGVQALDKLGVSCTVILRIGTQSWLVRTQ